MDVKLIQFTQNAIDLLIFTKSTRLSMDAGLIESIAEMTDQQKAEQLEYIANTIPSSWEFVDYTFLVSGVSRAYTHQQVRTRAASYAQQSMRVVDMTGFDYIYPERTKGDAAIKSVIDDHIMQTKWAYGRLKQLGAATEDARGVLPTNISTNIVCKFNLRTFSELVKSRAGGRTQGEYRDVVKAMAAAVLEVHPWAEQFLFPKGKDYFAAIEEFAERKFGGDLKAKGELLKIVDKMRKER